MSNAILKLKKILPMENKEDITEVTQLATNHRTRQTVVLFVYYFMPQWNIVNYISNATV